jgi:endoglycosylceramidase
VVYAPHYYRPLTVALGRWHGMTVGMNRAFASMTGTAEQWDAPLFLGEFGAAGNTRNAGDYVSAIYDRMDEAFASGAQWTYSPRWNERDKDGWNGEDFSILDSSGAVRSNFRPRPYPRFTAGMPVAFHYADGPSTDGQSSLVFTWQHRPELGTTELFLPRSVFPSDSKIETSEPTLTCQRDEVRQLLVCQCDRATTVSIRVSALIIHQRDAQSRSQPVHAMRFQ